MNVPKGFRYKSDLETFCAVVDAAQILIKSKALFILFGFESDVSFQDLFSERDFDSIGFSVDKQTFEQVLNNEILYLINIKIMETDPDSGIKAYLAKQQDMSPGEQAKIMDIYQKKMAYVEAHLFPADGMRRSDFKLFTTNEKVQELDWDICKYVFNNGQEQPYAQFKLSLMRDLPDIRGNAEAEPEQFQFVCDAQDVAYLIERLKQIQARLESL